jgi:hypothetical protein
VQPPNNQQRLFFVQLDLVACSRVGEGRVEPFVERFDRIEDLGEDEIEEGPEFGKVVLERCTGENETVAGVVIRRKRLSEFALRVL